MNVVLSKFYLSTAGSSRVVKDNLLPADHSRSHQAYSLERLFSSKKRRFPGGAVCQGCFIMSLLL